MRLMASFHHQAVRLPVAPHPAVLPQAAAPRPAHLLPVRALPAPVAIAVNIAIGTGLRTRFASTRTVAGVGKTIKAVLV